jgi:hypothetical protein
MSVDCQNIIYIYITQLKNSWEFHFAPAIVRGMCGGIIYDI